MDNYIPKCRMTPYETCYKSLDIQAVGGMAVGSISVSNAILANLLYKHNININTFYVRKVDKSHGKAGRVVGMVEKGVKVTIVDDVITTGRSINAAIEFIQSERNSIVVAVLSIIDRQEGGSETITEKYNIPVISAFTMTDILGVEDKN
jgi:orotate phosphoribosyltransferase